MNRRQLLKTLGALAVAASLPRSVAREWAETRIIPGQRFVLHEPFVVPEGLHVLFEPCSFEPAPDFLGDALLAFEGSVQTVEFPEVTFNLKGRTDVYAMTVRGGMIEELHFGQLHLMGDDPKPDSIRDALFPSYEVSASGSGYFV